MYNSYLTAVGAAVAGSAGTETLSKFSTVSQATNRTHPVIKLIQKRLLSLDYTQIGDADGVAGVNFERAVKAFQTANNLTSDGEITKGGPTWRKLLELN